MKKPLQDKVAIITGSSRGIGAEIARTLAGAGAKVVVNYLGNQKAAEAVCTAIAEAGGESQAVKADVSNSAEMCKLFDAAVERFNRVDILVNNAGVLLSRSIAEISDEEFDRVLGSCILPERRVGHEIFYYFNVFAGGCWRVLEQRRR